MFWKWRPERASLHEEESESFQASSCTWVRLSCWLGLLGGYFLYCLLSNHYPSQNFQNGLSYGQTEKEIRKCDKSHKFLELICLNNVGWREHCSWQPWAFVNSISSLQFSFTDMVLLAYPSLMADVFPKWPSTSELIALKQLLHLRFLDFG